MGYLKGVKCPYDLQSTCEPQIYCMVIEHFGQKDYIVVLNEKAVRIYIRTRKRR